MNNKHHCDKRYILVQLIFSFPLLLQRENAMLGLVVFHVISASRLYLQNIKVAIAMWELGTKTSPLRSKIHYSAHYHSRNSLKLPENLNWQLV
jgi:hypothetical protein